MNITIIGGGNMARALLGGLIARGYGSDALAVVEVDADARATVSARFGVATFATIESAAVAGADVIVIAVKPQNVRAVARELATLLKRQVVLTIAAGIRLSDLSRWLLGYRRLVRAMPNTPALIGAGAIGLCSNTRVGAEQHALAERILETAGITAWIDDEALMDTVTALSGSGPAYFFLLVEALENAAVAQGLPRETARALAAQTCLGAGRMLSEDGAAPAELRQRVTSTGGTTQAALDSFSASGFSAIVARAVAAATARGREMSEHFGDDDE
jgi:pyrroline-5-carboxylate reductase